MKSLQYKDFTDEELFKRLIHDDHKAYLTIYERYAQALYTRGLTKINDRELINDALQDIFISLWHNRHKTQITVSLERYLFSSLRYVIIRQLSRNKAKANYLESLNINNLTDTYSTDHLVREKELTYLLENEIASMPHKMQHVYRLSRERHLSHKEIADRLGLSEKTVKKHINNALKTLRHKFTYLRIFLTFLTSSIFF